MHMPWSDPALRGRWGKIGGVVLLVATLAGIAALAGSCSFLPRLLPVQAGRATPTATVSPVTGQPTIEVAPVAGDAGTRITIAGRGWRPGDTVFVRLEDVETGETPGLDQASAIVTDRGDFVVRFTYPYDPRWALLPRALVTVIDPGTGQRASVEFRILNPAPASPTALPTLAPASPVPTQVLPTAAIPTKVAPQPTGQVNQPTATRIPATATRVPPTATRVPPTPVPPTATPIPVITDWRGEYWANLNLAGNPIVVRNDYAVNFSWGFGAPAAQIPADSFSARWTRALDFQAGTYRFHLRMDDGARLWIDGQLVIDQWSDGSEREVTAERSVTQGRHDLRVEYYERTGLGGVELRWERVGDMTFPDWKGEYWNNRNLSGAPVLVRNDRIIDFNWSTGSPAPGLPADDFSVRWSRQFMFSPGVYRFFVQSDDGMAVLVDGRIVIDQWFDQSRTTPYSVDVSLAGQHLVSVQYYEHSGGAFARFWLQQIFLPPTATVTPTGVPPTATTTSTTIPPTATTTSTTVPPTATATATATWTSMPTATPSQTATATVSPTSGATATSTATATATPTATVTGTASPTLATSSTPTNTATPTLTPTETATPTASPTEASTSTPTWTPTSTPTDLPTSTPTYTATPTATSTATATAAETPTGTPTATETSTETPTATPTEEEGIPPVGRPTSTPTPTATATMVVPVSVRLNEILPRPERVNWDERGRVNAQDEWLEVYNPTTRAVDISRWTIEVPGRRQNEVFRIGRNTVVPAQAHLLFFGRETRLSLDDSGGTVRLLDATGRLMDIVRYPAMQADQSYSRDPQGVWHTGWLPSPGGPNLAPPPKQVGGATATPTATVLP